jgi:hypothetical protein
MASQKAGTQCQATHASRAVAGHSGEKQKFDLNIELTIAGILTIHLLLAWRTHYFITNLNKLTERQKSDQLLLNWSIPIIWSMVVRLRFKKKKIDVMTKDKRKRSSGTNTDDWMGLTGGGSDSGF